HTNGAKSDRTTTTTTTTTVCAGSAAFSRARIQRSACRWCSSRGVTMAAGVASSGMLSSCVDVFAYSLSTSCKKQTPKKGRAIGRNNGEITTNHDDAPIESTMRRWRRGRIKEGKAMTTTETNRWHLQDLRRGHRQLGARGGG